MKFCLCKFKYNYQVSYFDIYHKTKLVETFVALQKIFTWTEKVIVLQIIKIEEGRYISTYYRYIFQIYCEYIHNFYVAVASLLRCACSNEGFSKVIILYKSRFYVEIHSLLPWTFGSFLLIYHYNFLKLIQSHNIYSWHHIRSIYATPILSKYDFLSVHRSVPFLSDLIICVWNWLLCWHSFHSMALYNNTTNCFKIFF